MSATVSLCMIVKDGAATLERCLASVRPHVDEVCIYDTGSTDGTLELLEQLAAEPGPPIRVERGEWRDDFAWAREQSFAMASSNWQIYLDDDDVLIGGEHVRLLVATAEEESVDFLTVLYDCWDRRDGTAHHTWRERIVRRGSGKWGERVFEIYRTPDPTRTLFTHPGTLYVRHTSRTAEIERRVAQGRTRESYIEKQKDAAKHPEDSPRALFVLAITLMGNGENAQAAACLERYLADELDRVEGRWNVLRHDALIRIVHCLESLSNRPAATQDELLNNRRALTKYRRQLADYEKDLRRAEQRGEADPTLANRLVDFGEHWLKTRKPSEEPEVFRTISYAPTAVRQGAETVGRNDPCWCGSGRKYKRCHLNAQPQLEEVFS